MVNWSDPNLIANQEFVYKQLVVFLTGLYGWELVLTFWLDWAIISGKVRFKVSYIFWFCARYSVFPALVCLVVITRSQSKLNCASIIPYMSAAGLIAVSCSSTNLMLRTLAIWKYKPYIVWPLSILSLTQFVYLIYAGSTSLVSHWDATARACLIENRADNLLAGTFLYTAAYDFVIFCTTVIGIYRMRSRTTLWYLLYQQGVLYFTFTFVFNVPAALFTFLKLNAAMNTMFSPIASTMSTILSCRAVASLMTVEPSGSQQSRLERSTADPTPSKLFSTNIRADGSQFGFPSSVYADDNC